MRIQRTNYKRMSQLINSRNDEQQRHSQLARNVREQKKKSSMFITQIGGARISIDQIMNSNLQSSSTQVQNLKQKHRRNLSEIGESNGELIQSIDSPQKQKPDYDTMRIQSYRGSAGSPLLQETPSLQRSGLDRAKKSLLIKLGSQNERLYRSIDEQRGNSSPIRGIAQNSKMLISKKESSILNIDQIIMSEREEQDSE
ncbi:hypothetical protein FGO68_gene14965 [Halteria grandinella]|uniref:Uncharacterized protein n=1 Tax=Halteria grandinella TaxID=5974 RepID=A0A8J8T9C5_HALGN|nr:hypothetical protein FGO68_gene14965 [Halteria grandinella]